MKLLLLLIAESLVLTCIASNLGNGGVFNSPDANAYWKRRFGSNFGGSSAQRESSSTAFKQRFSSPSLNNEILTASKSSKSSSSNSYKNKFSSFPFNKVSSYGRPSRKYTSPYAFKTRFGSSSYESYSNTSPQYKFPKTLDTRFSSYPYNKGSYSRTSPQYTSSAYGYHNPKARFYPRMIYHPETPRYIIRSSSTPIWRRPTLYY